LRVSNAPAVAADAIDAILGAADDGPIATLRGQRPRLAAELQDYYRALFEPEVGSAMAFPLLDRYLVAVRVASHTASEAMADWYADLALAAGTSSETLVRVRDVAAPWPEATRLGAAIRHADLLTLRPIATSPADLQALKDAGYTPAGILSLSQTIAFVNYQLRLVAGLRAFGESA
jgi:CMD domain protein